MQWGLQQGRRGSEENPIWVLRLFLLCPIPGQNRRDGPVTVPGGHRKVKKGSQSKETKNIEKYLQYSATSVESILYVES